MAKERWGAQGIPRHVVILLQVSTKNVHCTGTTVSIAEIKCAMDMVSERRRGISFRQVAPHVIKSAGALLSTERDSHAMHCIGIRNWSGISSPTAGWTT